MNDRSKLFEYFMNNIYLCKITIQEIHVLIFLLFDMDVQRNFTIFQV